MTDIKKFQAWIVAIITVSILAYSFYTGMLLWGLIAAVLIIFLWVFMSIAGYFLEYAEINKKNLELSNRYYSRELEKIKDEKPVEKK
ncbi:MAG TPA: hypothetical protein VIO11_00725 [Candidatus Methanoperedens sp.]